MIRKFRTHLLVFLIATAILALALAIYDGQLTFWVAGFLAGVIIVLSLLASGNV